MYIVLSKVWGKPIAHKMWSPEQQSEHLLGLIRNVDLWPHLRPLL